jgi:anthranilate synthase component 1
VLPRFIVIFDHLRQTLSIEQVDRSELDESAAREIIRALRSPLEHKPAGGGFVVSQPKLPGDGVHDRIREVRRAIDEGMIYQAVVSERIEGRTDIDPLVVYRALRSLFPSPYLYYLNLAGKHVIGSSPETLVRLEGDLVQICPLSAIRACSGDARQDLSLGEELLSDPLETSKHHVFVEQARNDCASVCDPGSVQLARFKTVERSMKHIGLRSVIRGTKTGEYDQFDVYRSAFPAASVTGAPKAEAAALIIRLDSEPRGVYGGSVGYFSVNNTMEHAIAVRTIVIEDGGFTTQAGVVITAAGNPESEAMNIANKCRSLLRALEIGGELL